VLASFLRRPRSIPLRSTEPPLYASRRLRRDDLWRGAGAWPRLQGHRAFARWRWPPAVRGGRRSPLRPARQSATPAGSFIAFRPAVRPALLAGLSGRSRRPPRSAGAAVVF